MIELKGLAIAGFSIWMITEILSLLKPKLKIEKLPTAWIVLIIGFIIIFILKITNMIQNWKDIWWAYIIAVFCPAGIHSIIKNIFWGRPIYEKKLKENAKNI
jgi:SNF family Na+-dependent transporter